jgi:hypothetical protein
MDFNIRLRRNFKIINRSGAEPRQICTNDFIILKMLPIHHLKSAHLKFAHL